MTPNWKIDATKVLGKAEIAAVFADLKRKAKRSVNTRQNLIIFRLATCCGLRVSEICGLRCGDVRLGGGRLSRSVVGVGGVVLVTKPQTDDDSEQPKFRA